MAETDLAARMIARADADNLPADHELRTKAEAFDKAAKGFHVTGDYSVKRYVGAWASARRCWCDYTGEPLI